METVFSFMAFEKATKIFTSVIVLRQSSSKAKRKLCSTTKFIIRSIQTLSFHVLIKQRGYFQDSCIRKVARYKRIASDIFAVFQHNVLISEVLVRIKLSNEYVKVTVYSARFICTVCTRRIR